MKVPFVDLPALVREDRERYLQAFAATLDTGGFIGGPAVTDFEAAFAKYLGVSHAIAVKTGTDALLLALRAMGIGPGDEVITAANSFFATAEAIVLGGATPVFADVVEDTLLIDPADVRARITKQTKALIPVHLFGQVADMDAIGAIAREHGLQILEDTAQAHGASRGGVRAGAFANVAAFSFYPTKNLGALGEGGAVVTKDAAVAERVRSLRDHGQKGRHDHVDIGYNARLDAVQCACLSISLARLDERNEARRAIAARYARLAEVPGVRLVGNPRSGAYDVHHLYVIRVDAAKRDAIRDTLAAAGVATAIHYPTPIHQQKAFASYTRPGCPVAEVAAREMISLPMFPHMTTAQADHVVDAVARALT